MGREAKHLINCASTRHAGSENISNNNNDSSNKPFYTRYTRSQNWRLSSLRCPAYSDSCQLVATAHVLNGSRLKSLRCIYLSKNTHTHAHTHTRDQNPAISVSQRMIYSKWQETARKKNDGKTKCTERNTRLEARISTSYNVFQISASTLTIVL